MRKGGKVVVVHILFSSFLLPRHFIFPPHFLFGDQIRKRGTETLHLSEEFIEKFSEVFFRDD